MKILILIVTCLLIISCKKETVESKPKEKIAVSLNRAKVGDFIFDVHGKKYKKISSEIVGVSGIRTVELWERIDPLDVNHWYTPTLDSYVLTNSLPFFNALKKF